MTEYKKPWTWKRLSLMVGIMLYRNAIDLREKLHKLNPNSGVSPFRIFWWRFSFFFYKKAIALNEKFVKRAE